MSPAADGHLATLDLPAGFEVVAELGRGAAATVYRVSRHTDGNDYAIKVFDPGPTAPTVAMVSRQATLLARVDHPDLVAVHEVGMVDERPYLIMDLVEGEQLSSVIADRPLTPAQAISLARDVIGPLSAVHETGLVHRDVKPDNIMIQPDGRARLIDYGLAEREMPEDPDTAVGTLAYAPPEQSGVLNRPVDNRSDLYSLGVTLFECLTGTLPFRTADVGELLRMHAVAPPPDLTALVDGIPPGLAAIVAALLSKDPDDRYQKGAALAADLDRCTDQPFSMTRGAPRTGERQVLGPLVGRRDELAHLSGRWDRAGAGAGAICLVRGVEGCGKSRLAAEVAIRARASGALVLAGACSPDDPLPLAPLRVAVEALLRAVERLADAERAAALERLRTAAGAGAGLVATLTPALAEVLGPEQHVSADNRDNFTLALADFLTALAAGVAGSAGSAGSAGGLLLILDDTRWLDDNSQRLLKLLAPVLSDTPMLIIATDATNGPPDGGLGVPADHELTLGPLSDAEVAELIRGLAPRTTVPPDVIRVLSNRGEGNPFLTLEYLRAVVEAGMLRPSWGAWTLDATGLSALELPQDTLGLILTRVHGLADDARRVLAVAAVVGARFRPEIVAAALDLPAREVLDVLADAARRGLVEQRAAEEFGFVHNRIRGALLDELTDDHVARLHADVAAALRAQPVPPAGHDAEHVYAVAHHCMGAGTHLDPERAATACAAAGALALASYAPDLAVTFLRYASSRAPGDVDTELRVRLGTALKQCGRFSEAAQCLTEALGLESDPLRRARVHAALAVVHRSTWSLPAAREAIEQGLHDLGAGLPRNRAVLLLSSLWMALLAALMQWTGRGMGAAGPGSGSDRARCELISALHEVGGYLGVMSSHAEELLVHDLRGVYWGNRLGTGRQYVRAHASAGFLYGSLGLRRASARAFARAEADPGAAEPAERALISSYRGADAFIRGRDDGEIWKAAIRADGQWLDLATYTDATSTFVTEARYAGRTDETLMWWAASERRAALGAGAMTSLVFVPAMIHGFVGRHMDADAAQSECERALPYSISVNASMRVFLLVEQNETGPPLDEAIETFLTVAPRLRDMIRPQRIVYLNIALGRLAQCHAAAPDERARRLKQAEQALAMLRRAVADGVQAARALAANADLLVVRGRHREAIELLGRDLPFDRPDSPLATYEAARVRARALHALGSVPEALRHARLAIQVAEEQRWPHRAAWITSEFGVGSPSRSSRVVQTRAPSAAPTTTSGGLVSGSIDRQRLLALQQVGIAASRALDPRALARITLDEAIRLLRANRAFLFLTDDTPDERLRPLLGRDAQGNDIDEPTRYSASLVERVRVTREPIVVTGTEEGAALGAQSVVLYGLRSIMIGAIQLDERLLGVVYLDSQVAKGIFTADDVGILTALTYHIATALETNRAATLQIAMQAAQQQRDLADRLRAAFEAMTDTLEPDVVLARMLRSAPAVLPGARAWLLSPHVDTCMVRTAADGDDLAGGPIPPDPRCAALLAREHPGAIARSAVPDVFAVDLPDATGWMAVPLRSRGTAVGTVVVGTTEPDGGTDVVRALMTHGLTAYENATLFAQVRALAVADELTGIANRRHFFEVGRRDLSVAQRRGDPLSAMMIDIDHFKHVNDTYGHPVGDEVIRAVAARLSLHIRGTDLLGRYGGEEFALVLPDTTGAEDLPERLRACIADDPVETDAGPLAVTVSIGVTGLRAEDTDLGDLLARADTGLYRAKQSGRNRVCAV